jgi:PPOX class probable F420-dependent enzyme
MDYGVAAIDVPATVPDAGYMQRPNATARTTSTPLANERYIALTTFTRDGTAKSTPVWPVDAGDGRIGFITSSKTWKVKRINNDSRVVVQPSDAKGRVRADTPALQGSAEMIVDAAFESLHRKVQEKYGIQLRMINLLHALPGRRTGHHNDCGVLISLDPA